MYKYLVVQCLFIIISMYSVNIYGADYKGYLDGVNNTHIWGWVCDAYQPNTPLPVEIYTTGVHSDKCEYFNGIEACFLQVATANLIRSSTVGNLCGGNRYHGFQINTPYQIKNGGSHTLFAKTGAFKLSGSKSYKYFVEGIDKTWDGGLTKRCVRQSGDSAVSNYYEDISECPDDDHYYTLALQAEHTNQFGDQCAGSDELYFTGWHQGPHQFWWTGTGSNLVANLKTDIAAFYHPCGSDVWNWNVFGLRNKQSDNQFPRADKSGIHFTTFFNYWLPNATTRMFGICEAWWDGRGRSVVVNFVRTGTGDNIPDDPEVITHYPHLEPESVSYLGEVIGFGEHQKGTTKDYFLNCGSMFKRAVARGYLTAPTSWNNTELTKIWIGHELHNFSTTQSGVSSLQIKNYKVVELP